MQVNWNKSLMEHRTPECTHILRLPVVVETQKNSKRKRELPSKENKRLHSGYLPWCNGSRGCPGHLCKKKKSTLPMKQHWKHKMRVYFFFAAVTQQIMFLTVIMSNDVANLQLLWLHKHCIQDLNLYDWERSCSKWNHPNSPQLTQKCIRALILPDKDKSVDIKCNN